MPLLVLLVSLFLAFRDITNTGQSSLSETPWRTWWLISRSLNSLQQWLMLLVSYVPSFLPCDQKLTGQGGPYVSLPLALVEN
jgi:hypothetical protein